MANAAWSDAERQILRPVAARWGKYQGKGRFTVIFTVIFFNKIGIYSPIDDGDDDGW